MMTAILVVNIAIFLIFSFVASQPMPGQNKPSMIDFLSFAGFLLLVAGNAYIAMVLNQ